MASCPCDLLSKLTSARVQQVPLPESGGVRTIDECILTAPHPRADLPRIVRVENWDFITKYYRE